MTKMTALQKSIMSALAILATMVFSMAVHAALPQKLTCFSTAFEPYVIDNNGRISGIDVDIIKMAGADLGIDIEFSLMPWARLEIQLKAGHVDCVAAYFRTPEREAYMHFTGIPLHVTSYSLFVNAERSDTDFERIEDWQVGINRGFKTTQEFELAEADGRVSRVDLNSTQQGFVMLNLKRIDAVLTDVHVGQYLVKLNYPGKMSTMKPSFRSTPAYFVFAKKDKFKTLIPKFDGVLMKMMIDGRYKKVFDSYAK